MRPITGVTTRPLITTSSPVPPMVPAELVRVSMATITSIMRHALAAIFLFAYSVDSLAGDFFSNLEERHAAYNRGDYEAMQLPEEVVLGAVKYGHEQLQAEIDAINDLEDGNTAYNRGDYEAAFSKYWKAANQGHATAQFNVGAMWASGTGVIKSYKTAIVWYIKAGEQGHASAQNNLGAAYKSGEGVPRDYERAVNLQFLASS